MSNYLALPIGLVVRDSKIHGQGVFTTLPIEAGYDFGITHITDSRFKDGYIRTPLGGFINHSDSPNCEFYVQGDSIKFKTIRKINTNEELTAKYFLYSPFSD